MRLALLLMLIALTWVTIQSKIYMNRILKKMPQKSAQTQKPSKMQTITPTYDFDEDEMAELSDIDSRKFKELGLKSDNLTDNKISSALAINEKIIQGKNVIKNASSALEGFKSEIVFWAKLLQKKRSTYLRRPTV